MDGKVKIETAVNLIGELVSAVAQQPSEGFLENICGNCNLTLRECTTNMLIQDESDSEKEDNTKMPAIWNKGILRGHDVLNPPLYGEGSIEHPAFNIEEKKILRQKLSEIRNDIGYVLDSVDYLEKKLN